MLIVLLLFQLGIHKFIVLVMHIEGYNIHVRHVFMSVSCSRVPNFLLVLLDAIFNSLA